MKTFYILKQLVVFIHSFIKYKEYKKKEISILYSKLLLRSDLLGIFWWISFQNKCLWHFQGYV